MKKIIIALAAASFVFTSMAQGNWGTISFHNRNLSPATPGGPAYHAPIGGVTDAANARAQLYLVTGSGASATYTPLQPIQTFRTTAGQTEYFNSVVTVSVTGQAPGTTGLQFVVRAWQWADSWETASYRGESNLITVNAGLGGTTASGVIFLPPDLGGPNGLQSTLVPEPSTIAFALLGAGILFTRRNRV